MDQAKTQGSDQDSSQYSESSFQHRVEKSSKKKFFHQRTQRDAESRDEKKTVGASKEFAKWGFPWHELLELPFNYQEGNLQNDSDEKI